MLVLFAANLAFLSNKYSIFCQETDITLPYTSKNRPIYQEAAYFPTNWAYMETRPETIFCLS